MHKFTRLTFNSGGWSKPTGIQEKIDGNDTFVRNFGFGFEEWLFRKEWMIKGWRYGFIQGINNGKTKLLKGGVPFDLTLFTIRPTKKRQFIAKISDIEYLVPDEAAKIAKVFQANGWFDIMEREVRAVGGDHTQLTNTPLAENYLNCRFKLQNVSDLQSKPPVPVTRLKTYYSRYQLYRATLINLS